MRKNLAARGRVRRIGAFVVRAIGWLELVAFDVFENLRPQLHAVANCDGIGVRSYFVRAREHMKAAHDDDGALRPEPRGKLVCAARECEMHRNADHLRHRSVGRWTLQQVLIPVLHFPVWRCGSRDAREGERRREHMLAEARARIFGVEGIDHQRVARAGSRTRVGCGQSGRRHHVLRRPRGIALAHGLHDSCRISQFTLPKRRARPA